ncbi:MAG: type II toxin-antitoxin system VapC family toxin [Gammaproteobacteria bacterium]|nr:type II toxin-antitoxin system VapC family toxin [Gammaproteobacteria bacterium]
MILLDTNIVSEMMKKIPCPAVIKWITHQESMALYISTITIAEINYGIHVLQKRKQRHTLEKAFSQALNESFSNRVLFFDEEAAYAYGEIMSLRKQLGKPLSILDGQIAAIAHVNHASVATRNMKDFLNCNLELINPFEY